MKQSQEKNKSAHVYWLTGLSGAGKTTVGTLVYDYMKQKKKNVIRLDGDILREVFQNKDYSHEGRKALGYQYARLCKMIADQGIDVVICTIVMFDEIRAWNRANIANYHEVYLRVSMEELMRRDQKGLYTRASNEKGVSVYGMDLDVELPKQPDLIIDNYGSTSPQEAFRMIAEKFAL